MITPHQTTPRAALLLRALLAEARAEDWAALAEQREIERLAAHLANHSVWTASEDIRADRTRLLLRERAWERERDRLLARIAALESVLSDALAVLTMTMTRVTGYDWNTDPDAMTRQQGDVWACGMALLDAPRPNEVPRDA